MTHSRLRITCALLAAVLLATSVILAGSTRAGTGIKVGRNIDIAGEGLPDRQVVEPAIAVDPRNPDILVAGAGDLRLAEIGTGAPWPGYYRSTDGGTTWSSSLLPGFPGDTSSQGLASPLRQVDSGLDPSVAFDGAGNVYYLSGGSKLTAAGTPDAKTFELFVSKFADDGADFVGATMVPIPNSSPSTPDFGRLAVDATGGPHDGNVYVTFLCCSDFSGSFSRSTDGGLSFSSPIPTPGGGITVGVTVDAAGSVYVESIHCTGHSFFCTSDASATILVSKSTDGGLSFQNAVVAANIKPIPSFLPGMKARTLTTPQIKADANGVYIVWDDYRTGDADVLFTRSTDGGLTWASPLRVNDVTVGHQFFPTVAVSGGIISVAWYDSRLATLATGNITGLDVFYAESTDAGSSFSTSVRVTTATFDPNLVFLPLFQTESAFIGDYISIAASPNAVHPIWTDNRNACDTIDPTFGCVDQDVFTAAIAP